MLVEPRMARRERQRVTALPVHIIQRGNNRQACFYAEADHLFFLHHLRELAKRAQCEVHAYVLACYRYIELNPVRANMVKHPVEYPWSSHAANAEGKPAAWLTPHGEYLALGSDEEKRRAAYRDLFTTELDQNLLRGLRVSAHSGYAIGSSRFRQEIESALKLRAAPRGPGRPTTGARL